jgi:starch synthase
MTPSKNLKVLMVSAECHPFAKVGGLADVVGSLPKALAPLGGEGEVLMPFYKRVQEGPWKFVPHPEVPMVRLDGPLAGTFPVLQCRIGGVPVSFVGHPDYFDRDGVYDDPATGEGWPDQPLRWIFFCQAAAALIRAMKAPPAVVHLHDHHTALVAAFAVERGLASKTLLHIHNLAYQGDADPALAPFLALPAAWAHPGQPLEFWGRLNFLKAGIHFADRVVTVSPTYAREVTEGPEMGMGMEGVLRAKGDRFSGILNGIDTAGWDPAADPLLPYHYSAAEPANKAKVKEALLHAFGLPAMGHGTALVGMVTRLADQKGLDLVAGAFEAMMRMPLQMVLLGTGQHKYHELFTGLQRRFPHAFGLKLGFDDRIAHLIEGGADLFLMPSHFEPCGLNQLYSLRYGAVPLVRRTGGLADTVVRVPDGGGAGNGFAFTEKTAEALLAELRRALGFFRDREAWAGIVRRGMEADFSWDASAKKFMELYRSML